MRPAIFTDWFANTFLFLLICLSLTTAGCSPSTRQAVARSVAAGAAGASGTNSYSARLLIFGGLNHRVYLGCLNCSEYSGDSIFNRYGTYGSSYSDSSIWNHFGEYGSRYSDYGACNKFATDPPVIVDSNGNYKSPPFITKSTTKA